MNMRFPLTLLAFTLLLSACGLSNEQSALNNQDATRITVAASFYPLAHFAQQVAGDHADVLQVLPDGAEPHHYEPTPRDIALLVRADVIVLNGAGLMGWEERVEQMPEVRDAVVVTMADHIALRSAFSADVDAEEHAHDDDHPEEGDHHHGAYDPHFWLDPVHAITEVEIIRAALQQADPTNAEAYDRNAAAYVAELRTLDAEFKSRLQKCALDTIIVGHDSFGYTGARYGFHSLAIADVHGGELSARVIANITDAVHNLGMKHIFVETLTSPKLSETIARETGTETLVLDTIHGRTSNDSKDQGYIPLMQRNLHNIRTALQCP